MPHFTVGETSTIYIYTPWVLSAESLVYSGPCHPRGYVEYFNINFEASNASGPLAARLQRRGAVPQTLGLTSGLSILYITMFHPPMQQIEHSNLCKDSSIIRPELSGFVHISFP